MKGILLAYRWCWLAFVALVLAGYTILPATAIVILTATESVWYLLAFAGLPLLYGLTTPFAAEVFGWVEEEFDDLT